MYFSELKVPLREPYTTNLVYIRQTENENVKGIVTSFQVFLGRINFWLIDIDIEIEVNLTYQFEIVK